MLRDHARAVVRRLGALVLVFGMAVMTAACLPAENTTGTSAGDTTGTTTAGGSTSTSGAWLQLVIMAAAIGAIFYFLLIRPQRTRQRRQQELQSSISVGDEVQTIGGILGTVEYFDKETDTAVLQIEGGGKLRVVRKALADKVRPKGQ